MNAGPTRAEVRPTLDEALAATLQDDALPSRMVREPKTCRTFTDLGRRSRRATICMARADWNVLVKAAHAPTARRAAPVKLAGAEHARS